MLDSKFMITLVAMFAVIITLFKKEIKESYIDLDRGSSIIDTPNGLARNGRFSGWQGAGAQYTTVGNTAIARGGVPIDVPNYKLGYDMSQAFPRGVEAKRSMQTVPPPRFQVTGPKLDHYMPVDMAKYGVDLDKPIANNGCDVVHSDFGQVQRSSPTTKENFNMEYENAQVKLPSDMCNVNMLGTESQPVVYDRVMYSNTRSRTRGQGDYIRGDLMIAPDNYKPGGGGHPGWFQVSAKPNRDLNPGCMEHLFGKKQEIALGLAQGDVDVASFGL